MAGLTSAINVNVDKNIKKQATDILNDLGLNMSTAINIFLTQVVKQNGIPFEIKNTKPSKELIEALKETNSLVDKQGYRNIEDLFEALNNSD